MKAHYSSKTNEWGTPQDLFDKLNAEFTFTLDPCASKDNHKCDRYFTKDQDGLIRKWQGETVFMNPPYGRQIGLWMSKAYDEALIAGVTVVCLIPARTDTKYWHNYVMKAHEIRFIKGRLCFNDGEGRAPFPSAIIVFKGRPNGSTIVSSYEL